MLPSGTNRNGFNAQDARPILPHFLVSNSIRAAIADSTARPGTISMTIHGLPLVTPGRAAAPVPTTTPVIDTDDTVKHTAIRVAQQQEAGKQEQPRSSKTIVVAQTSTGLKEVPTVLPDGRSTTTTIPFTTIVDVTTVIQEPVNPTDPATPVSATTTKTSANVGMMVGFSLAGLFFVTSVLIAFLYRRSRLKYRRTAGGQTPLAMVSNAARPAAPQKMKIRIGKLVTLKATVVPSAPEPADPFDDAYDAQQSRHFRANLAEAPSRPDSILAGSFARRISVGSESLVSDATLPSYRTYAVIKPNRT